MRSFMFLPLIVSVTIMLLFAAALEGCCDPNRPDCPQDDDGTGGGQDAIVVDLPLDMGDTTQCVQGVGDAYSHHYTSTYYDVDLDTPNYERDPVFAPIGGIAYVHGDDRATGFGVHVNIDAGDGTYILLGHLDDVFVDDESEVAAGQLLAFEGTTGNSTGDHVHMGRHDGDPAQDGTEGVSIEGLAIRMTDTTQGVTADITTSGMTCDIASGHWYASLLATSRWHPDGTLVKTPDQSTVYLLDNGSVRAFTDETAFWSRGYDFDNVALVSNAEMDCYGVGTHVTGENDITAVFDSGVVWLVFTDDGERQRVASVGWQGVLKSWGVTAATYDDLPSSSSVLGFTGLDERSTTAAFRDGSLVSEASSSTVYVMSDGVAMPVETWDAYLLLGFEDRTVIEVDDGVVDAVMGAVGNCATNAYCVSREDVVTCGGPNVDDEGSYPEHEDTGEAADASTGNDSSTSPEPSSGVLAVTWTTPSGAAADRITLSGEYTHTDGWSDGWQTLASEAGLASLTYEVVDAVPGDALRFSAEFVQDGATSWSCLAPYPPGTVQGTVTATYRGGVLDVIAADDPGSDGCGLTVTVP